VPPIHDITTDPDNPPPFVAVVPLRQGEGINSVAYEGAKVAEQQRQAYPDVVPLTIGLAPDVAFARALDTAQRMGWTVVASDKAAGRIEASQRSRWMGFTDDIIVRVTPASWAAASTYARLRAMGAVISASMPAFAITSRRCVRPQPAKVSARPSSLAVLLPDARDCRWQNNWPVAPRGNCREPAAGFQWGGSQLRAAAGRIDPSAPIPAVRWRCRYYFSAQSRTGSSLKRAKHWARTDWKCFRLASQGPSTSARACALAQSRAPKRDAASVR